jgi:hypothetical protein
MAWIFFALEALRIVFAACARKGMPAITGAPLRMGVSFLCFMPGKMTSEEYFQNKFLISWRPWGNNNPMQRLSLKKARIKISG